jgi:hypothetical protein
MDEHGLLSHNRMDNSLWILVSDLEVIDVQANVLQDDA